MLTIGTAALPLADIGGHMDWDGGWGVVMMIAMLTLPAAVAGYFTRGLRSMMIAASVLSVLFTLAGLAFSYGPDLPAGATTIVIAGATYLVVSLISAARAKTARV